MRYQELIYIQNQHSGVRNKDIVNVNMSSDICVFEAPLFSISGASKLDCSGSTGTTYIITTETEIPLVFNFTANTNTFTANTATFKYEIYKYNENANIFAQPSVYRSSNFDYTSLSGGSLLYQNIPISPLSLDGEYLIKGYYNFSACTEFLGALGKKIDTSQYKNGSEYALYNPNTDFYFIAFKGAEKPILLNNGSNLVAANQLYQQVILPENNQTTFTISFLNQGFFIITLNGLVLSQTYDYTYTGNVVTMNAPLVKGDIVTVIYTTNGGNNLVGDNINITSAITSGTTGNEGSNSVYYNTTTSKYEIYTTVTPASGGNILVMLNGATLATGIDYYQSTTNPKRIILVGNLLVGDLITIVYFPSVSVINGIITNTPSVSWQVPTAPQKANGVFTLEVSTGKSFTTLYTSSSQPYIEGVSLYYDTFIASGSVGTQLYYRVKNEKNYETLCGNIINDTEYSEVIPIIIQTNSINSY
jgi:hypothetical protein